MARLIWKGAISFGLIHIPVHLYPAEQRNELHFTFLDRRTMQPVGYQRINKESGKVVPWEEIVRGYEYEKGNYVVLGEEDFRRANVEATQTVDILSFTRMQDVPFIYFETPYYLVPAPRGEKSYALLRETLNRARKIALAYVVIHTRQYLAALIPMDKMLVLNTLRYANEIRSMKEFELPGEDLKALGVKNKESEMALQLVEEMTESWKPEKYHDTYSEDVLALVEKKIRSGKIQSISEPEEKETQPRTAEVIDLMALLKRSIQEKEKESGRKVKRSMEIKPPKPKKRASR